MEERPKILDKFDAQTNGLTDSPLLSVSVAASTISSPWMSPWSDHDGAKMG